MVGVYDGIKIDTGALNAKGATPGNLTRQLSRGISALEGVDYLVSKQVLNTIESYKPTEYGELGVPVRFVLQLELCSVEKMHRKPTYQFFNTLELVCPCDLPFKVVKFYCGGDIMDSFVVELLPALATLHGMGQAYREEDNMIVPLPLGGTLPMDLFPVLKHNDVVVKLFFDNEDWVSNLGGQKIALRATTYNLVTRPEWAAIPWEPKFWFSTYMAKWSNDYPNVFIQGSYKLCVSLFLSHCGDRVDAIVVAGSILRTRLEKIRLISSCTTAIEWDIDPDGDHADGLVLRLTNTKADTVIDFSKPSKHELEFEGYLDGQSEFGTPAWYSAIVYGVVSSCVCATGGAYDKLLSP
jgi:hypothetical protein